MRSQNAPSPSRLPVTLEGRKLTLSNIDKVLYPKAHFTKGHVIDYYIHIAPVLLPHLRDRPLTLKRYPQGVDGPFFYEKNCPEFRPRWIKTAPVWSEKKGDQICYCLLNDLAALVWAANLADLELHTSLARYPKTDRPAVMVFDLDPGPGADVLDCGTVALHLRDYLKTRKLKAFVKTSGSKGLQVYVPLNTPVTYNQTKEFAHALALKLEREFPDTVVSKMSKALRPGKVFVDWSQNDSHKTTVCVYSLRAREQPTVSTPVQWSEVEYAVKNKAPKQLVFASDAVLKRVERLGDLFAPVNSLKQKLPSPPAL